MQRIQDAAGIAAIPAVVYVAVAMAGPGHVRHSGRGDLILPEAAGKHDLLQMFTAAGIPCTLSGNIEGELWAKLIVNCAYNPISALTRAQYGRILASALTREVLIRVVEEAVAVACAAGIRLPSSSMADDAVNLGYVMANATSSTAQDLARGKRTEIDAFNGYVARRGAELGVPAPLNLALYALVKLLEETVP
jgi:2-dehydropantoate 2-reductase